MESEDKSGEEWLSFSALPSFGRCLPLASHTGRLKMVSPADLGQNPILLDSLGEPLEQALEGFPFGQTYLGQASLSLYNRGVGLSPPPDKHDSPN